MPRSKPPSKAKKPAKPSRTKAPAKKALARPQSQPRAVRSAAESSDKQRSARPKGVRGRPFQPGQSGNPGGRPKLEGRIRELAQSHGEAAIETLAKLLKHRNPKIKLGAAEALLNRGFGRPPQAIQMSFLQGDLAQRIAGLSAEEKRQVAQGDLRPLVGRG